MHSNMNFPAPLAILGFLGAAAGLVLAGILIVGALTVRKRRFAKWTAYVAGCAVVVYLSLLLGFSLASQDVLLAKGSEKYFCEMDCHLAYSVLDVARTKQVTTAAGARTPAGVFYVVKLRTRFDESTIAPWRGNGPLAPGPRVARVIDARGRQFAPVAQTGDGLLPDGNFPLLTPLRPGATYSTELVFDLPADALSPRLLLTSATSWPDHLLIGEENSLLHRKTWFAL